MTTNRVKQHEDAELEALIRLWATTKGLIRAASRAARNSLIMVMVCCVLLSGLAMFKRPPEETTHTFKMWFYPAQGES